MTVLRVETEGSIERWTLNRPDLRNALNLELVAELRAALKNAEGRNSEVVVLRGAGRSFCAGADLRFLASHDAQAGETPRQLLTQIWDLTLEMEHSAVVFVAALHGHAVAGGLELALASDFVIAAADTLIGDGHVKHALVAGGGASARLERCLGKSTARWLGLTGDLLPASDPKFALWLLATPTADEMSDVVDELVHSLIATSSPARSAYKRMLNDAHLPLDRHDRDRELDAFDSHWLSHDIPHVLRAFLDKNRQAS